MMLSDACLSVWRLSLTYIGPKSRTEEPRKIKIGTEAAHSHVTRTPLSQSKGQRSTCLTGKKKVIACAHFLLCFALLRQCRHKLGKIAQCLFFRVVVSFSEFSGKYCSLWRFSYLQLIMVRLAGGGGILCCHAQPTCYYYQYVSLDIRIIMRPWQREVCALRSTTLSRTSTITSHHKVDWVRCTAGFFTAHLASAPHCSHYRQYIYTHCQYYLIFISICNW